MEINITLGQKVKNFRKRAGLSQLDLETKIGASPGSVSRIESGEVNPTKETLVKIIEELNLNIYDSTSLFNVNIKEDIHSFIDVSKKLIETSNLSEILDLVTHNLVNNLDVFTCTIWLWNPEEKYLRLSGLRTKIDVLEFTQKMLGYNLLDLKLNPGNKNVESNSYYKAFSLDTIDYAYSIKDLASTFFSGNVCNIIQRWLNLKLAISIPLKFKSEKLGVLGIQWKRESVTEGEIIMIQTFADQIAMAIYNAMRYEELQKKYELLLESKNGK